MMTTTRWGAPAVAAASETAPERTAAAPETRPAPAPAAEDGSEPTELLRIATAGSVDDGKSTLIGRLLLDSKAIYEDQLAAIERASRQRGDAEVDLALLTDGLRAEREQGITIDVAYRYFSTPRRKFVIADTPGHVQYTRNMVTGASTAELAIVLIDARKGVLTQSRRHGFIATLLQIPHILVAVNKMDLVGYDEAVFTAIAAEYKAFAEQLSVRSVAFIPIAALHGDNVVNASEHMPWYTGPSLMQYLEAVDAGMHRNRLDFRFPVQLAVRPHQDFRGFAGQVASGEVSVGDDVLVLPSRQVSRVRTIVAGGEEMATAAQGDSVILTLEHEIDISRGDMIVHPHNPPHAANRLEATLCWLSTESLDPKRSYLLQHTTRQVSATIAKIRHRIDVDTLEQHAAGALNLNEIGEVTLYTTQPLFFDDYAANRSTGSFILIDAYSHNTVAAGMIRSRTSGALPPAPLSKPSDQVDTTAATEVFRQPVAPESLRGGAEVDHLAAARPRSTNVVWENAAVTRAQRELRNGHAAAVLWFTGLSGAGKSTVAQALEQRLFALGCQTFYLDGDNVRHGLNGDLGFSAAERKENIRRVAEVAKLAFDHGHLALCTFISPFREDRDSARALLPQGRFLEIAVNCELDECIRRDPKGLYKRALAGDLPEFTGVSSPYEEPPAPEIAIATDALSVEQCVEAILLELRRRGILLDRTGSDEEYEI
jgi:bifunctional enzyme CysN/CysC